MKLFVTWNSNIVIKYHPTIGVKVYQLEKKCQALASLKLWGRLFTFRLGRSSLNFNQLIKLAAFICLYRWQWPSVFRNGLFPWSSFNLVQLCPYSGFLPACQMFYVTSSGLWHSLCILSLLWKEWAYCVTLRNYFPSACRGRCSNSKRLPFWSLGCTYIASSSHFREHMKYIFFLLLKVRKHTHRTEVYQPYFWPLYNSKS